MNANEIVQNTKCKNYFALCNEVVFGGSNHQAKATFDNTEDALNDIASLGMAKIVQFPIVARPEV